MTNVVGIPVELLFSVIGGFGVYIFLDHKKDVKEKLVEIHVEIEKLKEANKELSRDEFEQVKTYVRESISNVLNSRQFRTELKDSVKEAMLHYDNNKKHQSNIEINEIKTLLNSLIKSLNKWNKD